ncbi:hypothetical protein HMPREF9412_1941 [Paenibacillus sp. HGF5]|nr:hypothetical protein HMPREF9412_1941 [Paenibacillus sp. HGF5]
MDQNEKFKIHDRSGLSSTDLTKLLHIEQHIFSVYVQPKSDKEEYKQNFGHGSLETMTNYNNMLN